MAAPSSESYVAPAPQPVEQAEVARPPTLVSGRVQHYRGYVTRQTTVLKRWKQNWIEIEPGKKRQKQRLDLNVVVIQFCNLIGLFCHTL